MQSENGGRGGVAEARTRHDRALAIKYERFKMYTALV